MKKKEKLKITSMESNEPTIGKPYLTTSIVSLPIIPASDNPSGQVKTRPCTISYPSTLNYLTGAGDGPYTNYVVQDVVYERPMPIFHRD